jgi:hypothetical protein
MSATPATWEAEIGRTGKNVYKTPSHPSKCRNYKRRSQYRLVWAKSKTLSLK